MKDRNVSKLSDHVIKKGTVATPLNHALKSSLQFSSWAEDRLPEYLWIGLILRNYNRREGLELCGLILKDIAELNLNITQPRLSSILKLAKEQQRSIFSIIQNYTESYLLSPLSLVINGKNHYDFNEAFLDTTQTVGERLDIIDDALREFYNHQSHDATDLRFLVIMYMCFAGKIHFSHEVEGTIEALSEYAYIEHDDDRMKSYRPRIRAMEMFDMEGDDKSFQKKFWMELGIMDECKAFFIQHEVGIKAYEDLLPDTRRALEYVIASERDGLLGNDKFIVFIGSITYVLKIFEEIEAGNLGNSILGRHGTRTMSEVLIILKYMLKHEVENANIWGEYKYYGISKLKLILLKSREHEGEETTHFAESIIDILVNEDRWEEFIDIDLKYFDKLNIRAKSTDVGEKYLYDILYDYDSGFVHGLWGAIRESSMLACDNPSHKFHSVPDINHAQKLPSVVRDMEDMLLRIMGVFNEQYHLPDWYEEKYQEGMQ